MFSGCEAPFVARGDGRSSLRESVRPSEEACEVGLLSGSRLEGEVETAGDDDRLIEPV